jgi:hypothetical protein
MTRSAVRILLVLAVVVAAVVPLGALEVSNGLVKLTLHEGIGRFSIAGLAKASGGSYTPLLVAQDPRTSMVSLLVADRVIRLGESSDFRESVEKTATGARFTWTSKQLVVTETFTFIGAPGADIASGVRVDLEVKNTTTRDVTVGVRYLFDTWLGEASSVHFRTDTVAGLSREMTVTGNDRAAYWISPLADDTEGFGFECMLSGEGVTVPDRVVFANWKRLSDAPWSYTTSSARTFSQAPYSMNDSAVGQYYDARPVPRGESMTITLALGRASPAGLTLKTVTTQVASTATTVTETTTATEATTTEATTTEATTTEATTTEATTTEATTTEATTTEATTTEATTETATETASGTPPVSETLTTARGDLAEVNGLLKEIDRLLALGADMTADELTALEKAVAALKERASLYGPGR